MSAAVAPAPGGDDRKEKREPLEKPGDGKSGLFVVEIDGVPAVFDTAAGADAAADAFGGAAVQWQL